MKRYLLPILIVLLLASVFVVACGQKAPHSEDDVLASFSRIARAQTPPTFPVCQDYLRYWSTQIILGKVKHIGKAIYEVRFPDMEFIGVEIWRVDMESSKIYPGNSGALLSALVLFCEDRNDKTGDCQLYLRLLDGLLGK